MRRNVRNHLLGSSSAVLVTLLLAPSVLAQDASAPEEVTVSASRINIAGFEAPTPVTVVGLAQLQRDAQLDIGDELRDLPQIGAGVSMNNGGNAANASQGD